MSEHKGTITPIAKRWEKDLYKIYICKAKDPNAFGGDSEITISGEIPDLLIGAPYDINSYMTKSEKYGTGFKVLSIVPTKGVKNDDSVYTQYLYSCTSKTRADDILKVYPNFVNMVINNRMNEINVDKLYNIGVKTLNDIKYNIMNKIKLMDVIEEYSKYGITFRIADAIFTICMKNVELLRERMNKDPYSLLCAVSHVGFKTADEIILKFKPELINSRFRLIEGIKYVLEENENSGNTYIAFKDAYAKAFELCPEAIGHMLNIVETHKDFELNEEDRTVGLTRTAEKERYIAERFLELKKASVNWGDVEPDYEKFRKVGKFDMTDEQIKALPSLFNSNCVLLVGNAGTGKSSSTIGLLNFLDSIGKSYTLLCPTGAASEVLSKATNGRNTSTIHKEIYANKRAMEQYEEEYGEPSEPIYIYSDVVLIDESSMVNIELMYDLLQQVREGTKVVLVGDPQQLPPIGAGLCFDNLIESGMFSTCKLTHVFRYNEGGLATFVENIRVGNRIFEKDVKLNKITQYGDKKDLIVIKSDNKEQMVSDIVDVYMGMINSGRSIMDVIIATPQNVGEVGTVAINKLIQNKISKGQPFIAFNGVELRLGDKVYQNVNCYDKESVSGKSETIFNSNQGIICDLDTKDETLVVDFNGKKLVYNSETFIQLNLAYAVSVHKLQGSGFPVVLAVGSSSHTYMLNRNLIYTQLTRASEKVLYFIDKTATINSAVKKYENTIRNTNLIKYLKESDKLVDKELSMWYNEL